MDAATCRICTKPVAAPFRVYDARGHVVSGCIGADHDGHLVTPSESSRWHNRPEAKKMRAASARHLRTIVGAR